MLLIRENGAGFRDKKQDCDNKGFQENATKAQISNQETERPSSPAGLPELTQTKQKQKYRMVFSGFQREQQVFYRCRSKEVQLATI